MKSGLRPAWTAYDGGQKPYKIENLELAPPNPLQPPLPSTPHPCPGDMPGHVRTRPRTMPGHVRTRPRTMPGRVRARPQTMPGHARTRPRTMAKISIELVLLRFSSRRSATVAGRPNCRSCVFMSVRGIKQEPHQYGKERVPLGVLEESLVNGLRLLFATHLIDSKNFKRRNVSHVW